METLGFIAFIALISFVAFRSAFFGLKLLAGCAWTAWVIYCIAHPPFGLTAGEGTHIALIVVSIGMGLMVVLVGLGRGIKRSQDSSGNFTATSEGFQWKIPNWMKGSEAQRREYRQQKQRDIGEYRDRIHRALHPHEGKRR